MPDFGDVKVTVIPFYSGDLIPGLVSELDIGVMPLDDGLWERGKCAMKALIYMAGGKPVICSPVGENVHLVRHGVNGLLAASDEDWVRHLVALTENPDLRRTLGRNGRSTVERGYSTEVCFQLLWAHVFFQAARAPGAGRRGRTVVSGNAATPSSVVSLPNP